MFVWSIKGFGQWSKCMKDFPKKIWPLNERSPFRDWTEDEWIKYTSTFPKTEGHGTNNSNIKSPEPKDRDGKRTSKGSS